MDPEIWELEMDLIQRRIHIASRLPMEAQSQLSMRSIISSRNTQMSRSTTIRATRGLGPFPSTHRVHTGHKSSSIMYRTLINPNRILSVISNQLVFLLTLVLLVIAFQPATVHGMGMFELRVDQFANFLNTDASGSCCASSSSSSATATSSQRGSKCSRQCDTYLRICFYNYHTKLEPQAVCSFGEKVMKVPAAINSNRHNYASFTNDLKVSSSSLSSVFSSNSVQFRFNFTWPGDFTMTIEAYHTALTGNNEGDTPYMAASRGLISRYYVQQARLTVDDHWVSRSLHSSFLDAPHTGLKVSFRVVCNHHYYGDKCGKYCKPRDDQFGHYMCGSDGSKKCLNGWTGPYCLTPVCKAGCHSEHGYCNKPGECKCRYGWKGENCDSCIPYPGCVHGTCTQPWQCTCKSGWGGLFCNQDLNYCTTHRPCQNGATCINTGQGAYTCMCREGFMGKNCDVRIETCDDEPCRNGATCRNNGTTSGYTCDCPVGYIGEHCESLASECLATSCRNGGTCTNGPSGIRCLCPSGYEGDSCEHRLTTCELYFCGNGTCKPHDDGFQCECDPAYTGSRCEISIDECDALRCQNDGTCVTDESTGNMRCQCKPGFVGTNCGENVDDCMTAPCANGGTCTDLVNDFECRCEPGFAGKDCSINIDECHDNPCLNGGKCIDKVAEYECRCTAHFYGKNCQNSTRPELAFAGPYIEDLMVTTGESSMEPRSEIKFGHGWTNGEIFLVISGSIVVPFMIMGIMALIVYYIRKYLKIQRIKKRDEAEARLQNEINAAAAGNDSRKGPRMNNNKCYDTTGTPPNIIFNPIDRIPPMDKCATLGPNSKLSNYSKLELSTGQHEGNLYGNCLESNLQRAKSHHKISLPDSQYGINNNNQHQLKKSVGNVHGLTVKTTDSLKKQTLPPIDSIDGKIGIYSTLGLIHGQQIAKKKKTNFNPAQHPNRASIYSYLPANSVAVAAANAAPLSRQAGPLSPSQQQQQQSNVNAIYQSLAIYGTTSSGAPTSRGTSTSSSSPYHRLGSVVHRPHPRNSSASRPQTVYMTNTSSNSSGLSVAIPPDAMSHHHLPMAPPPPTTNVQTQHTYSPYQHLPAPSVRSSDYYHLGPNGAIQSTCQRQRSISGHHPLQGTAGTLTVKPLLSPPMGDNPYSLYSSIPVSQPTQASGQRNMTSGQQSLLV